MVTHVKLTEMQETLFTLEGKVCNASEEGSTAQEFDAWISQYVNVENVDRSAWPLLLRWKVINFALDNGVNLFTDEQEQVCTGEQNDTSEMLSASS